MRLSEADVGPRKPDEEPVGRVIAVDPDDPLNITIQSTPEQFARVIAHLSEETGESEAEMIHRVMAAGVGHRGVVLTNDLGAGSVTVVLPGPPGTKEAEDEPL